ncbi:YcxB family protein [Streptomyces sp. NPDC058464]|uniref:YcxB family protein n=1 Tax=Streptomyces sp. NPDC058464 TaxID=3346511 RepID=UPI0036612458
MRQDMEGGAAVEFGYRLTAADFREALWARARRSSAGRVQTFLAPLISLVAVVATLVFTGTRLTVGIITLVLGAAVISWGVVRRTRAMAHGMADFMEPYGQTRMVADDHGAVLTGEQASSTVEWTVFKEYLETPRIFVLLGNDRAVAFAVLPKRGARDGADVERLRAILDRNLKRR